MSLEDFKDKFRWAYDEAWCKGNLDALDEVYAADCVNYWPPFPVANGLEAIKQSIKIGVILRIQYANMPVKFILRKTLTFLLTTLALQKADAQLMESFRHLGEVGVAVGAAHYFGDLNPDLRVNRPKMAAGVFYRRRLSEYIGLRISGDFAMLGYSDMYSNNPVQRRRNLIAAGGKWPDLRPGDHGRVEGRQSRHGPFLD